MALIYDGIECPLCSKPISTQNDEIFATSGVFINPINSLWEYCDAAMHWDCYEGWQHREEFAGLYFKQQIENKGIT